MKEKGSSLSASFGEARSQVLAESFIQFLGELESAISRFRAQLVVGLGTETSPQAPVRGERQEAIARLGGLATPEGLTAADISKKVEYDEANTYTVLNSLEKTGLIETVPDSSPKRWRLAERHLRDPILKASRVIRPGEWTTYGDIAIAVGGNKNGARAVGRIAATHPAFSNPHRVINQGGIINPSWRGFGVGPEECRRRLESEKVRFAGDAADPKCRVSWEEIDERLRAVENPS